MTSCFMYGHRGLMMQKFAGAVLHAFDSFVVLLLGLVAVAWDASPINSNSLSSAFREPLVFRNKAYAIR